MQIKEMMINLYKTKCTKRKISWIIVHYTACLSSAEGVCQSMARFKPKDKQTSTHYIVDSKQIIHSVDEDNFTAWHCATVGKTVYCKARNMNSIGVDMCEKKIDLSTKSADDSDWFFTDETIENAACLIASLMKKYNIDIDHVVRHYDVTHKRCPAPFVGNDINKHFCISGNDQWKVFKEKIKGML